MVVEGIFEHFFIRFVSKGGAERCDGGGVGVVAMVTEMTVTIIKHSVAINTINIIAIFSVVVT